MSEDRPDHPYPATTADEIRAAAERLALPFTDAQIRRIHQAVLSLEESAARLRRGLQRNDEPAYGYRHPAGEPDGR